jgi:hypothetical protein
MPGELLAASARGVSNTCNYCVCKSYLCLARLLPGSQVRRSSLHAELRNLPLLCRPKDQVLSRFARISGDYHFKTAAPAFRPGEELFRIQFEKLLDRFNRIRIDSANRTIGGSL